MLVAVEAFVAPFFFLFLIIENRSSERTASSYAAELKILLHDVHSNGGSSNELKKMNIK